MAPVSYRLVEALALLPILYLPRDQENVVLCTGPLAATIASDVLRWRDICRVCFLEPPPTPLMDPRQKTPRADPRVSVGMPKPGSCTALLTSPGEDPTPYLGLISRDAIVCVSREDPAAVPAMLTLMRTAFPKGVIPWREYLPAELYGCLASPGGKPLLVRDPPGGARRLTPAWLRAMMSFGVDECRMLFGPPPVTPAPGLATAPR